MKADGKGLPEAVKAGDVLAGVLICPFGEFPHGETIQVCDHDAFVRLVARWRVAGAKEVLCDFEHASEVDRVDSDTRAAAWIANLAVSRDGLVGDMKFTDEGAAAVSNRRLRFLSPVWTLGPDGRPRSLRSVALTNRPNIHGEPVLNKEPASNQNPKPEKENAKMEKIKELLGLAPGATDEEVLAAVGRMRDELAEARNEREAAEAEAFAEENKAKCSKDALKGAYLMNKEAAKALVAGIPAAPAKAEAPAQVLLNKGGAATPAIPRAGDPRAEMAALPASKRAAYYEAHKGEF
ncbi:MAG: phage protease [Kiritimatiellia bacterium]